MHTRPYLRIHDLSPDDRPREKLLHHGIRTLSNVELLGLLIGSGRPNMSAIMLAQCLLHQYDNDLNQLAKCSVSELKQFAGIGNAKAAIILSALELTRRRCNQALPSKPFLNHSKAVYNFMKRYLSDKVHEEFWVLLLNNSCRLLHQEQISTGGLTSTTVDVRKIFKAATTHHATQIILVHNHPSGVPSPSSADECLTRKLVHAAIYNDYIIADHLIFSDTSYFSFKDEGKMPSVDSDILLA